MLKQIPIDQLRVGMHVERLCGNWLAHPFWRTRFPIRSRQDIDRLTEGGVSEVVIDTLRGIDTQEPVATARAEPASAAHARAPAAPPPAKPAAASAAPSPTPMAAELAHATRICREARDTMASMFAQARMGKAIDAGSTFALVDEITASVARNPGAFVSLARLKTADDYTYMHSVAVCGLMIALGRQLGLQGEALRQAGLGGLLHDLGKARLPIDVLNKPGRLTDFEFSLVRRHPELGHAMLVEAGDAGTVALDVCLHHHERVDGSGYPHGLHGEALSLHARMGAVCDVYDAITSNRPYKAGWDPAESISRMAGWAGSHFDERVFHAFVKSIGIYPVGSLVRLTSGRLAVVVEQNPAALTLPQVRAFFSTSSGLRIPPVQLDLSRAGEPDRIVSREDPQRWDFRDLDEIWAGAGQ